MGRSKKRPRDEGEQHLAEGLQRVRDGVESLDALIAKLGEVAGHRLELDAEAFSQCVKSQWKPVSAADAADAAAAAEEKGEAAAEAAQADAGPDSVVVAAVFTRAKRARKGGASCQAAATSAPLSEIVWLLKHHGVERTPAARTAQRSGLQESSAASEAFQAYYKAQGIVSGEGEWETFMASMRTSLPMTLRVCVTRAYSPFIQRQLKEMLGDSEKFALKELAWCRRGGDDSIVRAVCCSHEAFHNAESEDLKRMQQWCADQTSLGTGQYQEAVSMIPPLLLDAGPDDLVLDMCSAPGSKLLQVADTMLEQAQKRGTPIQGGILSNEIDRKKALQVIPARLKRTHTQCVMGISGDARMLPALHVKREPEVEGLPAFKRILFDRVMADVPCSGDGTGRKDISVWETWSPHYALGLHPKQLSILLKGLEHLRTGGRLVYSTCSLNPLENEAVVNAALLLKRGEVRVVEVPKDTAFAQNLKWSPGMPKWGLPGADDVAALTYEAPSGLSEADLRAKHGWESSMFRGFSPQVEGKAAPEPVSDEELARCLRVHPHDNDTGGFFIAVFERVADCPLVRAGEEQVKLPRKMEKAELVQKKAEVEALEAAGQGKTKEEKKEDRKRDRVKNSFDVLSGMWGAKQYYHMRSDVDDAWHELSDWYGMGPDPLGTEELRARRLLVQLDENDRSNKRKIVLTTPGVKTLLHSMIPCTQSNKVKVTAVGARIVTQLRGNYMKNNCPCGYRAAFESSADLAFLSTERKVRIPPQAFVSLLNDKQATLDYLKTLAEGSVTGVDVNDTAHWQGPCMVSLSDPRLEDPAFVSANGSWTTIWLPCIMLGSKIEVHVEDHERVGLATLTKKVFADCFPQC